MFYMKYLTMYEVHMHAGAIRTSLHGCAYLREIIHSLKLVDYLPVYSHKSYNNLHIHYKDVLDSELKPHPGHVPRAKNIWILRGLPSKASFPNKNSLQQLTS